MIRQIDPRAIVAVEPEDPAEQIIKIYIKDYQRHGDHNYRKGFADCFRALYNLDLRVFHLSDRTVGVLRRAGIVNISQLVEYGRDNLRSLQGINSKRFSEIEDILDEFENYA